MSPFIANPLTWVYFPTALMLGALHALEPGHAKTLTAAYLIGIKGTKRDAVLLGLSVAITHSSVVVALSVIALWLGRESFTQDASHWLQVASGVVVIVLGFWMLFRRLRARRKTAALIRARSLERSLEHHNHDHHIRDHHSHGHDDHHKDHKHDHDHNHNSDQHSHHTHRDHDKHHHHVDHHDEHDHHDDHDHDHDHDHSMPEYAQRGERPTLSQIVMFGAAGGMIPCPASLTVMLLALSIGEITAGLIAVAGFSLGLAVTLVGIGMIVVAGITHLPNRGPFHWLSARAPIMSAIVVILSGIAALAFAH